MAYEFASVLIFALVGAIFVGAMVFVSSLVNPKIPNPDKSAIYECGERPIGKAWFNFNPRFYVIALIFVLFEVEIALMLPVALVYKTFVKGGFGGLVFFEILTFIVILSVGLAWVWARGDLDWLKKLSMTEKENP